MSGAPAATRAARDVLVAVRLYSRVPVTGRVGGWVGHDPGTLHRAAAHLPLVGWLVGAVAACAAWLAELAFEAAVVAVVATAASVLVTGAFHEDGFADTADALGGPADRRRALEIMTDSRLGTYGVVGIVLVLTTKLALLAQAASAGTARVCVALLVAHTLSRLCPLAVMTTLPYVGGLTAKAKPMADQVTRTSLAVAACWTAPAVLLAAWAVGPVAAVAAVAASAVLTVGAVRLLRRRLGGFTGDTLGATQQVCELAVYAAVVAG